MMLLMATFQSRDELVEAYLNLLELEKSLSEKLDEAERVEFKGDEILELIETQSKIIKEIETASELDREIWADRNSRVHAIMQDFSRLREENRKRLKEFMEEFEKEIDSLDQAHDLLKYYLQGGRRSGTESSSRIDREA